MNIGLPISSHDYLFFKLTQRKVSSKEARASRYSFLVYRIRKFNLRLNYPSGGHGRKFLCGSWI